MRLPEIHSHTICDFIMSRLQPIQKNSRLPYKDLLLFLLCLLSSFNICIQTIKHEPPASIRVDFHWRRLGSFHTNRVCVTFFNFFHYYLFPLLLSSALLTFQMCLLLFELFTRFFKQEEKFKSIISSTKSETFFIYSFC